MSTSKITLKKCDGPFGSNLKSIHYSSEGVRVIRLQNIGNGEFLSNDLTFISSEYYKTLGDHDVYEGDLLIAGLGDDKTIPPGRACVAPHGIESAMVKADCFRFRLNTKLVIPQFIAYQLSATANVASAVLSTGATRHRINLSSSSYRGVAFPPLSDQEEILKYIQKSQVPILRMIMRTEKDITLIREYRTRLITDVVTGKLDVRQLAATLPDIEDVPLNEPLEEEQEEEYYDEIQSDEGLD